jgi:hypothetical protein
MLIVLLLVCLYFFLVVWPAIAAPLRLTMADSHGRMRRRCRAALDGVYRDVTVVQSSLFYDINTKIRSIHFMNIAAHAALPRG